MASADQRSSSARLPVVARVQPARAADRGSFDWIVSQLAVAAYRGASARSATARTASFSRRVTTGAVWGSGAEAVSGCRPQASQRSRMAAVKLETVLGWAFSRRSHPDGQGTTRIVGRQFRKERMGRTTRTITQAEPEASPLPARETGEAAGVPAGAERHRRRVVSQRVRSRRLPPGGPAERGCQEPPAGQAPTSLKRCRLRAVCRIRGLSRLPRAG